jgi:tryptophan-rich hypothetical protein
MNRIHPNKLRHSKWTAVAPTHREKHFMVTEVLRDEDENVTDVILQAVLTNRERTLPWRALTNDNTWQTGWR